MIRPPNSRFSLTPTRSTLILMTGGIILLSGCQFVPQQESILAQEQKSQSSRTKPITTVDVAIANSQDFSTTQEYIGTTQPTTEVALRSQVGGTLINLSPEVGDWVEKGQVIGRIDDSLLLATVNQEQAELASLESELARDKIEVKNAEIRVEEALIKLKQAQSDRERYQDLAQQGLISQKEAESYATAAQVAQKTLMLAQESVNIAKQAVTSAMGRVAAQKSVVGESRQRQAYTQLIAETTGIVTQKSSEQGNLVREGEEILKIGNFDPIKVVVLVSELDLAHVNLGKTVEVKLDAFRQSSFIGEIKRIAPVANVATRQIPLEIVIPNQDNKIKGGLLARVSFIASTTPQIAVPESAIIQENGKNYVFVVTQENTKTKQAVVTRREVQLSDRSIYRANTIPSPQEKSGNRPNQKISILQGLKSGEKIVIRSSQPLTDGETVAMSILSQ